MCHSVSFEVRLFAQAAQLAATPRLRVQVESLRVKSNEEKLEQVTIQQIADQLCQECPQLTELVHRSRWALENEFVTHDQIVLSGQSVALIPPVSGG